MLNLLLLIGICVYFLYAFYDQYGMDYLKGKTQLKFPLVKRAKTDALIFIGLILLMLYQSYRELDTESLFLLATLIILSVHGAFIRSPMLVLKEKGFFYGNIYFSYAKIQQINLAAQNILVIDLKSGRRLLVQLKNAQDCEALVHFFGGYR